MRQPAAGSRVARLHRGGRGAEHERRAVALGPERHGFARVVARRLALLVRGVVLLVHDEEARIGNRCKGRRARPDHGARRPRADAVPGLGPFALRERGMQHRGVLGKLAPQLAGEDRRQRDFGDEPHGAAPGVERRPDCAQVDLRLAAAGDALEQRREIAPLANCGGDRVDCRGLLGGRRDEGGPRLGRRRGPACLLHEGPQQALRGQCAERRGARARRDADLRTGRRPPERREQGEDFPALAAAAERPGRLLAHDRPDRVGGLGAGAPPFGRRRGPDPPAVLQAAHGVVPLAPLARQVDDAHRLARGQPLEDRPFAGRRLAEADRSPFRDAVAHRPGGGQLRGQDRT